MEPRRVINVASVPHRSPFRYPGGKTWLVPHVREWLDSLESYPEEIIEPFAGGGIVGLSALFDGKCKHLTLVELDENVASVWRTILEGNHEWLVEQILTFEISEANVRKALTQDCSSIAERAFATILRNRMQRGGIMAPGASLMKNGENGHGLKSRWYPETLSKRIEAIAERRDAIQFIQGDGLTVISERSDCPDVVFFVDPPYTIAGRRLYSYSEIDHADLFRKLSQVRGEFLMTYDDSPEIRSLAMRFGFAYSEVVMKNTHHAVMTELMIHKPGRLGIHSLNSLQYSLFEGVQINGNPSR